MVERGFYIIKDSFFQYMNDKYLKGNKEENRPHYYCFKEEKSEIFWMIPLSSRVEKYKKIIKQKIKKYGVCDIVHIAKLDNGKESVFLIQDMFPITSNYIERKYTISNNHMKITSEHLANEIEIKARKVLKKLKNGVKFTPTQPDIKKMMFKLNAFRKSFK